MVVHDITLHGSWLLHITPNCDGFDPLQPWTHEGMGQVIQTGGLTSHVGPSQIPCSCV